jgi:hypothetical protein
LAEAAVCARVMVANGLLLEPSSVSTPFVATNQVAEKTDALCNRKNNVTNIETLPSRINNGTAVDFFVRILVTN